MKGSHKRLLINLIARYIDSPEAWMNFSKADPDFVYVCNKLLDQDALDYKKICWANFERRNGWRQGHKWYYYLAADNGREGRKHGPSSVEGIYYSYYRNGKLHGKEWEKRHSRGYDDKYDGNYLEYECDWINGQQHGWEIEYWGKGWCKNMSQYSNGKLHGIVVYYLDEEHAVGDGPIGFAFWLNNVEIKYCSLE